MLWLNKKILKVSYYRNIRVVFLLQDFLFLSELCIYCPTGKKLTKFLTPLLLISNWLL